MLVAVPAYMQVFLQLERKYEVKSLRFFQGDELVYKTSYSPDEWQRKRIESFIPSDNLILFTDGMVTLSEIHKVEYINQTAFAAGKIFSTFGAGWLLFGGIAHVATPFTFSTRDAVIGAVGLGLGALLTYRISKKRFTMGSITRLRIVDIGFPVPE